MDLAPFSLPFPFFLKVMLHANTNSSVSSPDPRVSRADKIKSRNADDILSTLKTSKPEHRRLLSIVRKNSGGDDAKQQAASAGGKPPPKPPRGGAKGSALQGSRVRDDSCSKQGSAGVKTPREKGSLFVRDRGLRSPRLCDKS
jgi:hypothetical protein